MSAVQEVLIGTEPFSRALFAEILPLAQKCWEENTEVKVETCAFYGERSFLIEPDVEQYERLAHSGALLLVTLRDEGKLCGYATGIIYSSLHHRGAKVGGADSFYIEPRYRLHVLELIRRFESALEDTGAVIIGWPAHRHSALYALLKARGYVEDDTVMEKRLCALQ